MPTTTTIEWLTFFADNFRTRGEVGAALTVYVDDRANRLTDAVRRAADSVDRIGISSTVPAEFSLLSGLLYSMTSSTRRCSTAR
jgi:hypothetical protein